MATVSPLGETSLGVVWERGPIRLLMGLFGMGYLFLACQASEGSA